MEGGPAHGLEQLMCVLGATPIYKGGMERRSALGAPQVGHGVLVGLLLACPMMVGRPPLSLYIRRQGAPLETQVDPRDHILSRVRCPPPPFTPPVILS